MPGHNHGLHAPKRDLLALATYLLLWATVLMALSLVVEF